MIAEKDSAGRIVRIVLPASFRPQYRPVPIDTSAEQMFRRQNPGR